MRFRKIAGVTAGTLVASALSVPAFMGTAHAATTSATVEVNQDCTVVSSGNTMATAYTESLTISADGTSVSVPASASGELHNAASGATFPTFKMETITLTVNALVNGEPVALSGTTTRPSGTGVALSGPLALPALTGTRTGTADVTEASVVGVAITGTLRVPYGPPGGSAAPVSFGCAPAQDSEIKQALQCTFGAFSFTYPAVIKARTSAKIARLESVTGFKSGMPEFVPVSKIVDNFNVTVAGTELVAKGVTSFDPPAPGNQSFVLPLAYAVRSGVSDTATSDVKVTGATLVMTSGGSDSSIACATTAWPTATTLAVTSPVAGQVNLVASIDNADAVGSVQFKNGAAVVATSPVVDGSASAELTDVSAGNYAYTAVFVPTEPAAFTTSTSQAANVTVAATQPCLDAEAALAVAQTGLATATTNANAWAVGTKSAMTKLSAANNAVVKATKAVTKASKAVTKAKKAAKKAKSKKAKSKAKKALSKAKKTLSKAKKTKSTASSKFKTAQSQYWTVKGKSTAANAKLAVAKSALTAAQNEVNQNC